MTAYIAIGCGLFLFSLITLLLSPYGLRHDLERKRVTNILSKAQKTEYYDEELSRPLYERLIKPILNAILRAIPKRSGKKEKKQNEKLKKMICQAGMSISVGEYAAIRLLILIGAAVLSGVGATALGYGANAVIAALLGVYVAYVAIRFHLTSNISKRRRSMEAQLPDVLDLLSVNVEAGLGFEQALLHVIGHFEGYLIDQLTITYREMTMGRTKADALGLFAERCDLNEVRTFVGAITQAEQLGISIKNVLRTQAAAIRAGRRSKVEEKAMKISVKILIPMVCFIFPVLLIVLMGPAAVKIYSEFKG